MVKDQHPVHAELLPRLQQERLPAHRAAVQRFALPVMECRLDDPDHEIRVPCPDVQILTLAEIQEPLAPQHPILARDDQPGHHAVRVAEHLVGILALDRPALFILSGPVPYIRHLPSAAPVAFFLVCATVFFPAAATRAAVFTPACFRAGAFAVPASSGSLSAVST